MTWRLASSLVKLRDQVNARHPNRSKASDGTIGDAAHASRSSDHNPWVGPGVVTAIDLTHDPVNGIDIDKFTDELAASRDPRIKYIIANGLILDSRPGMNPWKWVKYYGPNQHTRHVHISVMPSANLYDSNAPWNIPSLGAAAPAPAPAPAPPPAPAPRPSAPPFPLPRDHYFGLITGPAVRLIQQALQRKGFAPNYPAWADGKYEMPTKNAVAAWQRAHMPHTTRFGEVWWDDWAALLA